ncbi:hypothetical protein BsWGS_23804 [Bradybaena similaris]
MKATSSVLLLGFLLLQVFGCVSSSVCSLPSVTGPCRAYFPRYFYNPATGQCQEFVYGGCLGNANRFNTIEECQTACASGSNEPIVQASLCSLPSVTGPCRAYFPRYFYNPATGQCQEFVYGGCLGNANRFNTIEECQTACASGSNEPIVQASVCSLPPVAGPCRALFRKYFHNPATSQCQEFVYGGCSGNANRFDTIQECQTACASGSDEPIV